METYAVQNCRMENVIGRNVHLTPSGIDFDEHVFQLGQGTVVRAAGSVLFPRYGATDSGLRKIYIKLLACSCGTCDCLHCALSEAHLKAERC